VGEGRPAKIAATPGSYTGQFLKRYYKSSNGRLTPAESEAEIAAAPETSPNGSKGSSSNSADPGPAATTRSNGKRARQNSSPPANNRRKTSIKRS